MHSIVIFASGAGSNARAIIDYFHNSGKARVSLIVCNVPTAGVIEIACKEEIPYLLVDRKTFRETLMVEQIADHKPSLIVLAGFLWKIPDALVHAYPGRIINIHPALLPLYGGKGMFGHHVHQAVLAAGDRESGITIHYVNEHYDEGNIILQARCPVGPGYDASQLAGSIHKLEHYYYPRVIEFLLDELSRGK